MTVVSQDRFRAQSLIAATGRSLHIFRHLSLPHNHQQHVVPVPQHLLLCFSHGIYFI